MVQCDSCEEWTHFQCANVTSEIEHHAWSCLKCTTLNKNAEQIGTIPTSEKTHFQGGDVINSNQQNQLDGKSIGKSTGKSRSSSTRNVALALKRLEEERQLQEQRDTTYLNKKYELLKQIESDEEEDDSNIDIPTYPENLKQTENWARNLKGSLSEPGIKSRCMNKTNNTKSIPVLTNTEPIPTTSNATGLLAIKELSSNPKQSKFQSMAKKETDLNCTSRNTYHDFTLKNVQPLGQRIQTQQTYSSIEVPRLNRSANRGANNSTNRVQLENNNAEIQNHRNDLYRNALELNSLNIAARHVTSKDLPVFDGNPEDWPIFIANFETSTETCRYSNAENLIRLQRSLKGRALESVKCRLLLPDSVQDVIATLRRLFGKPELILHSMLQKLRSEPAPKQDKLESIINFSLSVDNVCATIAASGLVNHLSNPLLLQELVDKLPSNLKLQWGMVKQQFLSPTLNEFGVWLSDIARAASEVTLNVQAIQEVKCNKQSNKRSNSGGAFLNSHSISNSVEMESSTRKCLVCQAACDNVENCLKFKGLNLRKRWDVVKTYHLCRTCLNNHGPTRCKSDKICGKNNCTFKHNRLLHNDKKDSTAPESVVVKVDQASALTHDVVERHHQIDIKRILFRIVPVTLTNNTSKVDTFAFLDDGSSVTLIEESIANQLGLVGEPSPLCLKWTADAHRYEENSCKVSLNIIGTYTHAKTLRISVAHTVSSLGLPTQSINVEELVRRYPHLKNIPLASYNNAVPRILIGLNNWKLGVPLKIKEGQEPEPIAAKTRLGWTVCGPIEAVEVKSSYASSNSSFPNMQMCECQHESDNVIHQTIKNYFAFDSLGVTTKSYNNESNDDLRARQIMETTVRYINSRYEIGLLWRYDDVHLPNNYSIAMKRLQCLEKRLHREPNMKLNINDQIKSYISKGYISKLPKHEKNNDGPRIWYLPIFPVVNKNKPGKVRIVWDAASKVKDVCLNSVLLKGPDLLTSLPGILLRFRERRYALCGDIQEMFHQIVVRAEDRNAQRFLWRANTNDEPDVYVMNVLTFGASCSPCCSQFVKNYHAQKFIKTHPRSVYAIIRNHYVDDFLDSVDSEKEAVELIDEVKMIHDCGGFNMRNWISNSEVVSNKYSKDDNTKKNLSFEKNTEKVLGMWWCTSTDAFMFRFNTNESNSDCIAGTQKPTKRQLLRILMSTFDPLGLIANYLIYLKILLQDVWKCAIGWDECINDEQFSRWIKWTSLICVVEELRIPRCYLSRVAFCDVDDVQLHIFVDASEKAFATVAFIRTERQHEVECSLIGAKTRVSPIKPISIPRLELQAALLGARFSEYLKSELSITITKVIFWSDSKTVICWLRSTTRRYKQFVSFRIGEILEITNASQWRWIPSSINVADDATKWDASAKFDITSRWYNGPSFLRQPEIEWPIDLASQESTNEETLQSFHQQQSVPPASTMIDTNRFSSWTKLLRAQVIIDRFIKNAQAKRKNLSKLSENGTFTKEEYHNAEIKLYRQAQLDEFGHEILILKQTDDDMVKSKNHINRQSKIYRLTPYLDNEGLLRVGGRVNAAPGIDEYAKRPIILPRHHNITKLILHHYHCFYHHVNQETIVNEVRQKFSIPQLRIAVKTAIRNCQFCKNFKSQPRPPLMGELPPARLTAFTRPFSFVGVDYFRPVQVSLGRRSEKRWIMLITCMSTRAIHMEIAHSMTTDSCILAFRNFIARRGQPIEIHSDNGTNFHGMNNELKSEWTNVDKNRVADEFTTSTTKWIFIPPGSPHMGGSWERLVQSVKKVLNMMKPSRNPSDELLKSMLCEIENIINSRPLTYIPIDDENSEALTPNHFLLGSSNGAKPLGDFTDETMVLRKNWMVSQQMTNFFWRRWIREYLPTLTRRTKWFQAVRPIQEGEIVVVVDENSPRNTWVKGRVLKTYPGKDGQVRRATIQTQTGIYDRPSVKLAVLDLVSTNK